MSFKFRKKLAARILPLLAVMLLVVAVPFSHAQSQDGQGVAAITGNSGGTQSEYRLAPGDNISISVLGQEDLSVEKQVSDNNSIIYPLLGEVEVAGLTREETEDLIYSKLKGPYLVEPVVSVTILSYRQFYIQGAVRQPGPYPYTPGLTLRRAILDAGGFTELAAQGRIFLINEFRPDEGEKRVELSHQLNPGDIITVKESFF